MQIKLTGPMRDVITGDLMNRVQLSLEQFPELSEHVITVGLNRSNHLHGSADIRNMTIRLNPGLRGGVTYTTIGHELTHLLQKPGLGIVPNGEEQCDIWTLARSELFLDDRPFYLCSHLWTKKTWPQHASNIRALCQQAIAVRKTNWRYKMWLEQKIYEYMSEPMAAPLEQSQFSYRRATADLKLWPSSSPHSLLNWKPPAVVTLLLFITSSLRISDIFWLAR